MLKTIRKTVCSHTYELRSVETTEFVAFEKCSDCGKVRQRDASTVNVEEETEYSTAV